MATKTTKANKWKQAFEYLAQPWEDSQLKFKVQSMAKDKKSWAQVAAYVDARDVERRLNGLVDFGILWENKVEFVPITDQEERSIWAAKYTLVLYDSEVRIERTDVGLGDDPKGAASDGLKRAAVLYGMDDAYSGPRMFLGEGQFTDRGRILVDEQELIDVFRGRKERIEGSRPANGSQGGGQRSGGQSSSGGSNRPSEKQLNFLKSFLKRVEKKGGDPDEFLAYLMNGEVVDIEALDRREVGKLLDQLTKDFDVLLEEYLGNLPEGEVASAPGGDDLPF